MTSTLSRALAVALTCTAGAAVAVTTSGPAALSQAAPPGRAAAGLDRFHHQPVTWKKCALGEDDQAGRELDEAGARCADITVPLDYADPGGRTIKVAISRLAASGPDRRIGMMLVNGGGPGPAIDMPPYLRGVMKDTGRRYDLIGMDLRSIGRSAGVDCGWPTATWIRSAGPDRRSFDRSVAFARDLAERCGRAHADVLPHISTRNAARDMDVVRAVLGERRMSYSGASYGNYLGPVYAAMFPGRLDRVVLDSGLDPGRWVDRPLRGVEGANERALGNWAEWAARRHSTYRLGATRRAVLGTVRKIITASGREPLRVGPYRVDATVSPVVLFNLLQSDRDGPRADLAGAVAQLNKAAAGRAVPATGALAESLEFLLTGEESRYGSAQSALICGDGAAPRNPEVYWRGIQRSRKASPVFGALTNNINPCAFWPTPARERPTRIGGKLPALMVGATGDTRTIYPDTVLLHGLLKGSRLVTLKGADVHAPYQADYGSTCVQEQVDRYLSTGRLPAKDVTCAKSS